jgi:hypothetical protein
MLPGASEAFIFDEEFLGIDFFAQGRFERPALELLVVDPPHTVTT